MNLLRGERGEAVTETVFLVPAMLLLIMLVVQFGLWYHAEQVVQAAAQEGARIARAQGGTADDGRLRAVEFARAAGGKSVGSISVSTDRSADAVSIQVSGVASMVVPGLHLGVAARATSPLEEFRAP